MKICVVNTTSHDSSICLLENDEIVYFIQEERLSRIMILPPEPTSFESAINKFEPMEPAPPVMRILAFS